MTEYIFEVSMYRYVIQFWVWSQEIYSSKQISATNS